MLGLILMAWAYYLSYKKDLEILLRWIESGKIFLFPVTNLLSIFWDCQWECTIQSLLRSLVKLCVLKLHFISLAMFQKWVGHYIEMIFPHKNGRQVVLSSWTYVHCDYFLKIMAFDGVVQFFIWDWLWNGSNSSLHGKDLASNYPNCWYFKFFHWLYTVSFVCIVWKPISWKGRFNLGIKEFAWSYCISSCSM